MQITRVTRLPRFASLQISIEIVTDRLLIPNRYPLIGETSFSFRILIFLWLYENAKYRGYKVHVPGNDSIFQFQY